MLNNKQKYLLHVCFLILLLTFSTAGRASSPLILIVTPLNAAADIDNIVRILETTIKSEPNINAQIKIRPFNAIEDPENLDHITTANTFIITLGDLAFEKMLQLNAQYPVLAMLIYRSKYENLLNKYIPPPNKKRESFSAIFMEQPLQRSVNLVRSLLPPNRRVGTIGILLGPESSVLRQEMVSQAQDLGFRMQIAEVKENENPISALSYIMSESNFVIAIADSEVYNSKTAKGILLESFRKNVPVIGYSKAFVDVGALAAVYSTPRQIARQAAAAIIKACQTHKLAFEAPAYPSNFVIKVNYTIAKNLGLDINPEDDVKFRLEDLEIPNLNSELG